MLTNIQVLEFPGAAADCPPTRPASIEEAFRENARSVWRTLRRLGVPDAQLDDAVQDVFLVVHRRFDTFLKRSSFRTWLYGIVLRVASDYRKRQARSARRGVPTTLDDLPSGARGPEEHFLSKERTRQLHQILSSMTRDKREIFVLVELEELSVPEAAEALQIGLSGAHARLRRARLQFDMLATGAASGGAT